MSDPEVVGGSFRDPSGFVFRRDGVLYRQVNRAHEPDYARLFDSGLYENLTGAGLLVTHEEADVPPADPSVAFKVIRPEVVDFISYPYEWGFEQLRDAALATLDIQSRALDAGMSLRDASAYNIQFHRGRPVLIDTLSFETLPEGRPWIAYRQFCQHFLAPLALMSLRDVRLGRLLMAHIDGIPLDLATKLLPMRARLRMPLLIHLYLHARSQRRAPSASTNAGSRGFSLQAFRGLIDSLGGAIRKLKPAPTPSDWVDYYAEASHYSDTAHEHKKQLVGEFLEEAAPATVWDLGANTGMFSRIAAERGAFTVAFEMDPLAVDENYRRVKAGGERTLLPLVCDLTQPSPAIGWANRERMTMEERGPADVLLALAVVHHLAIANNVPLDDVAQHMARLGRNLVIEFVPKSDEKVQQLLSTRADIFPSYTQAGFETAFERHFSIKRAEEIKGSERVLYLMQVR